MFLNLQPLQLQKNSLYEKPYKSVNSIYVGEKVFMNLIGQKQSVTVIRDEVNKKVTLSSICISRNEVTLE